MPERRDLIEYLEIHGRCPFVSCFMPVPHLHPICPICHAVAFGNYTCGFCRQAHNFERS